MFPLRDNIPLARLPIITVALVALNVIAYLLAIRHGGSFFGGPANSVTARYGAIPYELAHPGAHCVLVSRPGAGEGVEAIACGRGSVTQLAPGAPGAWLPAAWMTALSSMFLHGSFLHLFGNMLFLAIFGPTLEDALGRIRFPLLYLAGGLIALGAQVLADPGSTGPTLGASGAIAAVLGAYIVLYPRARVLTLVLIVFFVTIVEVPAVLLLGFWFLVQLYLGLVGPASPLGGGGVAYFAHIGGFLFGLLAVRLLAGRRRSEPPLPLY
jgi:membrane associated rhomboid family serine protease